jgi:hypothetical protein
MAARHQGLRSATALLRQRPIQPCRRFSSGGKYFTAAAPAASERTGVAFWLAAAILGVGAPLAYNAYESVSTMLSLWFKPTALAFQELN